MNRGDLEKVRKYILNTNEGVNVIIQGDKVWLVILSSGKSFQLSDAEIEWQYKESMKLRVKASRLIDWMYSDDHDERSLGIYVSNKLSEDGVFNITIEDVFNSAEYIPSIIIDNYPFEYTRDFETSEVELIDDITL
jgi:hypothetical protein